VNRSQRAADAARILRGERCQNCDHYAVVTGCCWLLREKGSASYYRNSDGWCAKWHMDTQRAAGASLDEVVVLIGITRLPGESDSDLRQRARATVEDR